MDYTDGGGWAKLDKTAAVHLGEIIATFPKAKAEKYTTMLLILYTQMGNNGVITTGRRTLAKLAGVGEHIARYFLLKLAHDGAIIALGEEKGRVRFMFWWIAQKVSLNPPKSTQSRIDGQGEKRGDFSPGVGY